MPAKTELIIGFISEDFMKAIKGPQWNIGNMLEKFLATGAAPPSNDVQLPQTNGLTIVVESISWSRYMSHFQAVHRGSFFQTMRTTDVRKLTPDSWGFICPIHTPDGTPCGLLNHMAKDCEVVTEFIDAKNYPDVFVSIGMAPIDGVVKPDKEALRVLLDGRVVGTVANDDVHEFVHKLRLLKLDNKEISKYTEIGHVPHVEKPESAECGHYGGQYPGLFIFSTQNRMMRRVWNLERKEIELIGTLEQIYLHIAVTREEIIKGETTHMELSPTSNLSSLANLIPMPDCNQSPRNMYQCQVSTSFHIFITYFRFAYTNN
jgi:DNA-directed RNA polymerase I subunit RPA2